MNIAKEVEGEATIDINALVDVLDEYEDIILSDVYIGRRKGFLDNLEDDITNLTKENAKVKSGTIREAIDQFSDNIPELMK